MRGNLSPQMMHLPFELSSMPEHNNNVCQLTTTFTNHHPLSLPLTGPCSSTG